MDSALGFRCPHSAAVDSFSPARMHIRQSERFDQERNVLDPGQDFLGQRVAQKVSSAGKTASRKVDAAIGYIDRRVAGHPQ